MILVMRHGETDSNMSGQEKLRAWLPIPLDEVGMKSSLKTAKTIAKCAQDAKTLYSSVIVRAVQSAQNVANELNMVITPVIWLTDFNTGNMAGEKIDQKVIDIIHDYIKNPTKKIPGGESYNDFINRSYKELKKLVESKDLFIVVTHGRVTTLLAAMAKQKGGKPKTEDLLLKPPVDPSGLMVVSSTWKVHYSTPKAEANASKLS